MKETGWSDVVIAKYSQIIYGLSPFCIGNYGEAEDFLRLQRHILVDDVLHIGSMSIADVVGKDTFDIESGAFNIMVDLLYPAMAINEDAAKVAAKRDKLLVKLAAMS